MNRLLQLIDGKTVAVVGNGIEATDRSAEIDSADVVVRINHFYNYASGRVGKRCDIVMQTVTSTWFRTPDKNLEVVSSQKPEIFLVKKPGRYSAQFQETLGEGVRVNQSEMWFKDFWNYTTGGAVLAWFERNARNSKFVIAGFPYGDSWKSYVAKEARHYSATAGSEEAAMTATVIPNLLARTVVRPGSGIPRMVVVPCKRASEGAPGKNRALLEPLLSKLDGTGHAVTVVTDDDGLTGVAAEHRCSVYKAEPIGRLADVTQTLREWRDRTGWCGDIAVALCTSPRLRTGWIDGCFDALKSAPVAITAVGLGFKPTAVFKRGPAGMFAPAYGALPAATAPRQILPECVRFTGAVVACHTDALDSPSIFNAGFVVPVMTDEEDSLDVDTPEQLAEAVSAAGKETLK